MILRYLAISMADAKKSTTKKLQSELKKFFESELAERAAAGMSDGSCIKLLIEGENFYFLREKKANKLITAERDNPEVTFWIPINTMRRLLSELELPGSGLASMGISIFEAIISNEEDRKIKFKVHASFLTLWAKGYFSVLKAGGPELASYLARMGFSGIAQMKEFLKKIRG